MLFKNTNITPGIHSFSLEFLFFKNYLFYLYLGFPGGASGKESACQFRRCKRRRFHPWVGKIPWSRKWQFHFLSVVFILFWLLWVFVAASRPFSSCGEWGLLSSCGIRASHCGGFSCHRAPALDTWVSVVAASGL